jgi:hypothetical protein
MSYYFISETEKETERGKEGKKIKDNVQTFFIPLPLYLFKVMRV